MSVALKPLTVHRPGSTVTWNRTYYYKIGINGVSDWVIVSTKVRREVLEKAREYGINVSELLRRALEEEVKRREEVKEAAIRIANELKLSREEVARLIEEDRKR